MNKPETYKTDHPIIKEITIGDRFVLNDEKTIIYFYSYIKDFGFRMRDMKSNSYTCIYNINLTYKRNDYSVNTYWNIKYKYISIKEKIDLI